MVFESIMAPEKETLGNLFVDSVIITSASIFFANMIFPQYACIATLFLIALAMTPTLLKKLEGEVKETETRTPDNIFETRSDILQLYFALFMGILVTLTFWYVVLPNSLRESLFAMQLSEFKSIQNIKAGLMTAAVVAVAKNISLGAIVDAILVNNLQVLLVFLVFSFLFVGGSVFLIIWNASTAAVVIGEVIRSASAHYGNPIFGFLIGFPMALLNLGVHGTLEMIAYFLTATAGGMLSIGVTQGKFGKKEYLNILHDAGIMFGISVGLLIVAVVVESLIIVSQG